MGRRDNFDDSYRINHRPTYGAPLHDMTGNGEIYPEDFYSENGPRYYGASQIGRDDVITAQSYRGQPDKPVTIYRAVPRHVNEINPGDWVTINKGYAHLHGASALQGDYHVLEKTVPARHIINPGDSPSEWGYYPN
jgi:hypothetical protein